MNHESSYLLAVGRWFFPASIAFCAFLQLVAQADPLPAYAFSISSNQIPGGIWPQAVGSDEAGKVYISSQTNVFQVDTNGTLLQRWGTQGGGPGQFNYAGQLAFDGAGHVFVLDAYNYRVEEFDTNGNFVTAWGSQGVGVGQFDQPDGLAVSRSGRIYVSDSLNFRIQIFSRPGVFLKQFGSIGTNTSQFDFPGVIAVDSSNNVYVVDVPGGSFDNYRVQKFDGDGNFLLEWGPPGINSSGMIQVGGITTDGSNDVYVADTANNRIQKFTSDGVFLSQWGTLGSGRGQFNGPSGVALDPTGNYVYVADYYNARVDVFAYTSLGPLIYQPPTNQIVPAGATLTLTAGVFGAQPVSFQWQFNGTNIEGATSSVLLISNVSLTASGSYSILASNALGMATSASATITTVPTVVSTVPAGGISATSAVLYGSVWVGGNPTTTWFEWGTNTGYGNLGGFTDIGPNTSFVQLLLTNLEGEVIYHFRVAASNNLGVVYGQDLSFQVGLKPTVMTLPVIPTGPGTVLLNATVNPEARNTTAYFQWERYGPYEYTSTNQLPGGVAPVLIQSPISGLQPGALYQAQVVASNQLGTALGTLVEFIAPPWVLLPAPRAQVWSSIAVSADGTRLAAVAAGNVYLSVNSGMTWTLNDLGVSDLRTVTMSADGSRLVTGHGAFNSTGPAYFSTNGGKYWSKANGPNRSWYALGASGDGLRVAATDPINQAVVTTTNGGRDWQTNSPPTLASWDAIASSADGLHLIVAAGGTTNGPVFTSTNAGLTWMGAYALPIANWRAVASSVDGQILLAAIGGSQAGPIYISTNGGNSWSLTGAPIKNWQSLAMSADGSKIAALGLPAAAPLVISTNLGATWDSEVLPQSGWSDVAFSADGSRLFAMSEQFIAMLQTTPEPRLRMALNSGGLSLSWVIPSTSVVLQQVADLANPQWTDLPITPAGVLTNLLYEATVPLTNRAGFFRLRTIP